MIDRQRLDRKHVDRGACDLVLLQGFQQRRLIDDGAARGVDEVGGWLHAREVCSSDQTARPLTQHHMDSDDIGGLEQFLLGGVGHAHLLAPLRRQVRAPGDDIHAERFRQSRDLAAELAEADDAERPALDLVTDEFLPRLAFVHPRILATDIAGQLQDQAHGQRCGRIAGKLRAAEHDVVIFGRFHVDGGIAHARGDQELQFG